MARRIPEYNKHHILPVSRFWATTPRNLETLKIPTHNAIHTLFDNRMIAEQLLRTIDYSEKAMKPEVVKRLKEVLTAMDPSDPFNWYIDEVIE